ncbi:MAG: hypothetical protein EXS52_00425 [Candidatus Staskawiczbacteria bacterium]|nr:hypothetical protein [Candidatus Staskawiczbacteria bacterium]
MNLDNALGKLEASIETTERHFKLWAKLCTMVVNGKRKGETVSRVLDERLLDPDGDNKENPPEHMMATMFQDYWPRTLTMQWAQIAARLGYRGAPDGWWDEAFDARVCETLHDLIGMKLGPVRTCRVEFRNCIDNPPARELVEEDELGHTDFEIVDVSEVESRHHGRGPDASNQCIVNHCTIPARIKYREIIWPERPRAA